MKPVNKSIYFSNRYAQDVFENTSNFIPQSRWEILDEEQRNLLDNFHTIWVNEADVYPMVKECPDWLARGFPNGYVWLNRNKFRKIWDLNNGYEFMRALLIHTLVHEMTHMLHPTFNEEFVIERTETWILNGLELGALNLESSKTRAWLSFIAQKSKHWKIPACACARDAGN